MSSNDIWYSHLNRSVCKTTLTARIRVESASLSDNTTSCYTVTRSMFVYTSRHNLKRRNVSFTVADQNFDRNESAIILRRGNDRVTGTPHIMRQQKAHTTVSTKNEPPTKISVTLTFGKCRCRAHWMIAPTQIRTIVCYPLKKRSKLHTNRKRRYLFVQPPLLYRV